MSALNNDRVSRLVVSQIVAKTIYDLEIEEDIHYMTEPIIVYNPSRFFSICTPIESIIIRLSTTNNI